MLSLTPSLNDLIRYQSEIRGHDARLRYAFHGQCRIAGSGYQCSGAACRLGTKSVPSVGGNHTHGRGLHLERVGNAAICLGRRLKLSQIMDTEHAFEIPTQSSTLQLIIPGLSCLRSKRPSVVQIHFDV